MLLERSKRGEPGATPATGVDRNHPSLILYAEDNYAAGSSDLLA